jgi:hypothetical protein
MFTETRGIKRKEVASSGVFFSFNAVDSSYSLFEYSSK